MSEPAPHDARESSSLYDSPWFWVMLFSAAALVGLTLIGPKHLGRQDRLILKNEGHERAHASQLDDSDRDIAEDEDQPQLPKATVRVLMGALVCVMLVASYFVQRRVMRRSPHRSHAGHSNGPLPQR